MKKLMKNMKSSRKRWKSDEKGQQTGHENKIDLVICSNIEDLCLELEKFCAAKSARNTGVDNHINSILDKLLKERAIDKDEYNDLYKKIFITI